jgi:hypothetical protein
MNPKNTQEIYPLGRQGNRIFPPLARQHYSGLFRLIVEVSGSQAVRHITLGRTPQHEGSAHRRCLYLTTHDIHKTQDIHGPGGI